MLKTKQACKEKSKSPAFVDYTDGAGKLEMVETLKSTKESEEAGKRIIEARSAVGIRLGDAARKLGMLVSTLRNVELGYLVFVDKSDYDKAVEILKS